MIRLIYIFGRQMPICETLFAVLWPKTFHSEKPDPFYRIVEQALYPAYVDVFARKKRPGWSAWGNEIHEAA
jgi:N6-adenosine-specific RNA methylase IME4